MFEPELMRYIKTRAQEQKLGSIKELKVLVDAIDKKKILQKSHIKLIASVVLSKAQ